MIVRTLKGKVIVKVVIIFDDHIRLTPALMTVSRSGRELRIQSPETLWIGRCREFEQHHTSDSKILIYVYVWLRPSWFGSDLWSNRVQVTRDIGWVWVWVCRRDVIDLQYRKSIHEHRVYGMLPTSQLPAKGPRISALQKDWACAQTESVPPL